MAGVEGLEPPTYGFGDRCSAKLSYTPPRRTTIGASAVFRTIPAPHRIVGGQGLRGESRVDETAALNLASEVRHINSAERRGIVMAGPRTVGGAPQYQVMWQGGGGRSWVDAAQLVPVPPAALDWSSADEFRAELALAKLLHDFNDVLYSIGASRTDFLVHQYKPVLQFVRQAPHGLLLADEVGLGKTIEAALILRELHARGAVQRVLVVCPANLREKWRTELRERFSIELEDFRANDFRALQRTFEAHGYWRPFKAVTSLEGLRRVDVQRTLESMGLSFDLVIVDEAHHLRNPSTRSFGLGELLSAQSDHLLLLSATPIQTGQSDLLSLLHLIEPSEFASETLDDLDARLAPNAHLNQALRELVRADWSPRRVAGALRRVLETEHGPGFAENELFMSWLRRLERRATFSNEEAVRLRRELERMHTLAPYYTRTRKRDVADGAVRRAVVIEVPLTESERRFYDAWVRFLIELHRAERPGVHPGFWTVQRERQAASSLSAARARVEELIARQGFDSEFEGTDEQLYEVEDQRASFVQPTRRRELRAAVDKVRQAAKQLDGRDSKLERLLGLIRQLCAERPGRKLLIFTFFRSTLAHLEGALTKDGIGWASISGAVRPDERAAVVDGFRRDPRLDVLLSTEVGSEGLDFQFCDVVINYDLPWNPMRVEQRIGRIDRFGQEADEVIVASFFVQETIDTRVLKRLYERINVFEEAIGAVEPILGPIIRDLQAGALSGELSRDKQSQLVHERTQRVEYLKQQVEDFEDERAALLGHGDLLLQDIHGIKRSGRYISAPEVRALLGCWLEQDDPGGDGLVQTALSEVWQLHVSGAVLNQAREWISAKQRGSVAEGLFSKADQIGFAPVVFTPDAARQHAGARAEFLHNNHPLVEYAVSRLQLLEPPNWMARIGSFALPPPLRQADGSRPLGLAVFSLKMHDLESHESMLPIALELESHAERLQLADELLGSLPDADQAEPPGWLDHERITGIEQAALEYAERRRRREEAAARQQQAAKLAVQRTQLRRSLGSRIARKLELRDLVADERIKRLREGEARNLKSELKRRLAQLDAAPEPTTELELLSLAIFS